jgi:hypothetical protein
VRYLYPLSRHRERSEDVVVVVFLHTGSWRLIMVGENRGDQGSKFLRDQQAYRSDKSSPAEIFLGGGLSSLPTFL